VPLTPETAKAIAELPAAALLVFVVGLVVVAFWRGWIVTRSDHDRKVALLNEELKRRDQEAAYRETLRLEERKSRVAAEERLSRLTTTLAKVGDAVALRERDLDKLVEASRADRQTIVDFGERITELHGKFDELARGLRG
jgi:hypothetical protein